MLSKRTHPMIGKISELLVGGVNLSTATPFIDVLMTSPKSPLDFKILPQIFQRKSSSKRIFQGDSLGGSVGLGIVVASLENSKSNHLIMRSGPNQTDRSEPVHQFLNQEESTDYDDEEMFVMDEEEDYTLVTCHHNGSCSTRVYDRDGFECLTSKVKEDKKKKKRLFVVDVGIESPKSSPDDQFHFLSSCYLCTKKLHGHDIFIYRGEKAFCSTECRSSHIANDEKKKKCRSSNFATSPYTTGQIFSTGVLVT
ncbi:unnamed protein product [Cochlearia groenlandica]